MSSEPALIAKSNIIMEMKPWDDETDMKKLEECVRSISCDGLIWGACKFSRTVDALVLVYVHFMVMPVWGGCVFEWV